MPVTNLSSSDVRNLDELIHRLQAMRQEIGTGEVPVFFSVLNENTFETRTVDQYMEHVKTPEGKQFLELYL